MNLIEWQKTFQQFLFDRETETFRDVIKQSDFIEQPPRGTIDDRLNIYYKGYARRLIDGLIRDYPLLFQCCGEAYFEEMAKDYVRLHPSCYFNIREYSVGFPAHVKVYTNGKFPLWEEIAEFENTMESISIAENIPVMTIEDLAAITEEAWPDYVFELHPSVRFMKLHYDIPSAWVAITQNKSIDTELELLQETEWVLWRFNTNHSFSPLAMHDSLLLHLISEKSTFSQLLEKFSEFFEDEDALILSVMQGVQNWIKNNAIRGKPSSF